MPLFARCLVLGSALLVACSALEAQAHPATPREHDDATSGGRVRTYYMAADEVDWTFVPSRGDQALTGKKDDYGTFPGARGTLDPNATTYRKAQFREYTDSTFRTLRPPTAWTTPCRRAERMSTAGPSRSAPARRREMGAPRSGSTTRTWTRGRTSTRG